MSARARRRPGPLPVLYLLLAVVGLVLTWYCNLTYTGQDYLGDWFADRASASAAFDILVTFGVCAVFYLRESRRLGWRTWVPLLFTAGSLAIAVAFAFPLFLALRELRLRGGHDPLISPRERLRPLEGVALSASDAGIDP